MNTSRNLWGIASILSIVFMEFALDWLILKSFVEGKHVGFSSTLSICLLSFVVIFLLSILANWKYISRQGGQARKANHRLTDILKTLIKNSVSGDPLDLIFVLFFLFHLTWIPDSIFEFVKNDPQISCFWIRLARPVIYFSGLLLAVAVKPHFPKRETNEANVFLSAISSINTNPSGFSYDPFIQPISLKKGLEKVIVFYSESMTCAKDEATFTHLKKYGVSDQTIAELMEADKFNKEILKKILQESLAVYGITDIQLVACDYDNLKDLLSTVQSVVGDLMLKSDYKDENLLFNLTPGTKNISIALGIHSVKGNRTACYLKQDSKIPLKEKYTEVTLDVFELKDIFSELTD